ncbi:MAG TPA: glycosyltransferase [Candidatus Acidoferrum sp.]
MRILLVHNFYEHHGGEDAVYARERELLQSRGNVVTEYTRSNDEIRDYSLLQRAVLGPGTIWDRGTKDRLRDLLQREKFELAHFHNTLPLISPSAYYACAEANVPVVQTLHNYRLLCPSATLLREGKICEKCLGRGVPWPGVVHACYRDDTIASAAVATMLAMHRAMGTWRKKVGVYIALSEFAKNKFVAGGLPAHRIAVKPNFVTSEPVAARTGVGYVAFIGRLAEEKGVRILVAAWSGLGCRIPLRIVGDGPLKQEIELRLARDGIQSVELFGHLKTDGTMRVISGAAFLVYPSQCYETFGMAIIEAFACGVPVIASRLGSMAEIVEDGKTGLHFTAGDARDLAAKVEWAWAHPEEMQAMGRAARAEYEAKYTAERGYENLMKVYERALERAR